MEEVLQTQRVMSSSHSNPSTQSLHQAAQLLSKGSEQRGEGKSAAQQTGSHVMSSPLLFLEFIWKTIVFLLQDSLLIT